MVSTVDGPGFVHAGTPGCPDVRVHADRLATGRAAAADGTALLRDVLAERPSARVAFAAAPSQTGLLAGLRAASGIDWDRVVAFHLDEYVGLPATAPERFSAFLRRELMDAVRPAEFHALEPGDDPEAECARYARLLARAPIDLVFLGIGDNGHLAFNDPPTADFDDPDAVKVVELDGACRRQQVDDGCFPALADVPARAVTLTVPALLAAKRLVVTVPGDAKRTALRAALDGPITTDCPASVLRTHPRCVVHADRDAYGAA